MAKIHFQFICVHPFSDGNGRIGRILIDQLCLAFGLPTAMGGYPRTDKVQRRDYHAAIRECGENLNFDKLAKWIGRKIELNAHQIS